VNIAGRSITLDKLVKPAGVAGGGTKPGGVGVEPGAIVGALNAGTLQAGHPPPLHDASTVSAANETIQRVGKNARVLEIFIIFPSS